MDQQLNQKSNWFIIVVSMMQSYTSAKIATKVTLIICFERNVHIEYANRRQLRPLRQFCCCAPVFALKRTQLTVFESFSLNFNVNIDQVVDLLYIFHGNIFIVHDLHCAQMMIL